MGYKSFYKTGLSYFKGYTNVAKKYIDKLLALYGESTYGQNYVYAQFNPKQISNLHLWVDSSDLDTISLNGSNVAQWDDKSGNNNHLVQTTAADQPAFDTNKINSKPVITLDGSSDYLYRTLSSTYTNDKITVFFVARRISVVADSSNIIGGVLGLEDYGSNLYFLAAYQPGPSSIQIGAYRDFFTTQFLSRGSHPGNNVSYIYQTKFDGSNNTTYINNVSNPAQSTTGNFGFNRWQVGARILSGVPAGFSNMDIAEIIIYEKSLTIGEETAVYNYLKEKWGI